MLGDLFDFGDKDKALNDVQLAKEAIELQVAIQDSIDQVYQIYNFQVDEFTLKQKNHRYIVPGDRIRFADLAMACYQNGWLNVDDRSVCIPTPVMIEQFGEELAKAVAEWINLSRQYGIDILLYGFTRAGFITADLLEDGNIEYRRTDKVESEYFKELVDDIITKNKEMVERAL